MSQKLGHSRIRKGRIMAALAIAVIAVGVSALMWLWAPELASRRSTASLMPDGEQERLARTHLAEERHQRVQKLFYDPAFWQLPTEVQRASLMGIDPEFQALSVQEQNKVLVAICDSFASHPESHVRTSILHAMPSVPNPKPARPMHGLLPMGIALPLIVAVLFLKPARLRPISLRMWLRIAGGVLGCSLVAATLLYPPWTIELRDYQTGRLYDSVLAYGWIFAPPRDHSQDLHYAQSVRIDWSRIAIQTIVGCTIVFGSLVRPSAILARHPAMQLK